MDVDGSSDPPISRSLAYSVPLCLRGEMFGGFFFAPPRLRVAPALPITRSPDHQITRFPHTASSANCVATNGASWVAGCLRPEITLIHCSADSITITLTRATRSPQTAASS